MDLRSEAVSYTHLDVYKRQLSHYAQKMCAEMRIIMKIKKIISIILVAALCFTMAPLKANAKEETEKEFKEIRTIEDLYAINNDTSGNYRLMNDIDMTEETAKGGSWDTGQDVYKRQ